MDKKNVSSTLTYDVRSEHVNGEAHQLNPRVTIDTAILEVTRYLVDWVDGLPPLMCSSSDITLTKKSFFCEGAGHYHTFIARTATKYVIHMA